MAFRSIEDDGHGTGDEERSAALRQRAEQLHGGLVVEHDDGRAATSMSWRVPITEEHAP